MQPDAAFLHPLIVSYAVQLMLAVAAAMVLVVVVFIGKWEESGALPDEDSLALLGWGALAGGGGIVLLVLAGVATGEFSLSFGVAWDQLRPGLDLEAVLRDEGEMAVLGPLHWIVLMIAEQSLFEEVLFRVLLFAVPAQATAALLNRIAKWSSGEFMTARIEGVSYFVFALTSSAAFAAVHGGNPGAGENALFLANVFLIGLALAGTYRLWGGLWIPAGFHFGWNLLQVVFGLTLSGIPTGLPYHPVAAELTEGKFIAASSAGPEGGVLTTLIGVVWLGLLARTWWKRDNRPDRPPPEDYRTLPYRPG